MPLEAKEGMPFGPKQDRRISKPKAKHHRQPPHKIVKPGDAQITLSATVPLSFARRESRRQRPRDATHLVEMLDKSRFSIDLRASFRVAAQEQYAKQSKDLKMADMRREMDKLAKSIGLVDLENGGASVQNARNESSASPETHEQTDSGNDATAEGKRRREVVKPKLVSTDLCKRS